MSRNTKRVTITFDGEQGSGKSLMITAFRNFFSAISVPLQPMRDEHSIAVDLSDEDRNAIADFIIMRESQRRN